MGLRLRGWATIGGLLAATFAFGTPPTAVAATGTTTIATSSSSQALQHTAQDRVAQLADGSLLVAYWDSSSSSVKVDHVTSPSTTPVTTLVNEIFGGDEASITVSGSDIWIAVGSELDGLPKLEQVQHGTYTAGSFSWPALPQRIPGALTTGRQDPSVAWNGKFLIATWWDDTIGGNSDNIFYNWTADKSGATGWAVSDKSGTVATAFTPRSGTTAASMTIKNGTTAAPTIATATTITYTLVSGAAPAVGDWFQFGTAGTADIRQLTTVVPTAPPLYTLTVAALTFAHASGEADTTSTVITYTAGAGGAPAVGDLFEFGSGLGTSETRTVTAVTGSAPYVLSVAALANGHTAGEVDTTATRITYNAGSGGAPVVGDWFQFGKGNNCPCDAELRQVIAVSGSAPYILSVAALSNAHAAGEEVRIEAKELRPTANNSVQVSIRHSAHLAATIAVYGTACKIYTRTLLDSAVDPTSSNWTGEAPVDGGADDCEGNFGGPQIAIDENSGTIHVFKAVTNSNSPDWSGVTYWHGSMSNSGTVSWSARLIVDGTGVTATDPADVGGGVDSTGKVYIFWATSISNGAIKYVTLVSPFAAASAPATIATSGTQPRYPHVPANITGNFVPLVYQSGTGSPFSIVLETNYPDTMPPSVPTGVTATALSSPQVNVAWNASTDNIGVTGYTVYRNGVALATVSGTTLTYADKPVAPSTAYSYTVDAFDAAGNRSAQSAPASLITPGYTSYTAVTPVRLLDTRNTGQTLGPSVGLNLGIGGISVPGTATAVVLNVTATNGSTAGALVVYPTGSARPLASNLNWVAHETVPNLVTVGLGSAGNVTLYNPAGTTDVVVDLQGYYAPSGVTSAGEYVPVVPARITDTRPGSGQPNSGLTLGSLGNLNVQVTGMGGIPSTGVSAVAMNVTATNTTAAGFFTVFPTGASLPLASDLNWTAGTTVPNRVIVPVGTSGMVSFHNGLGNADLIVDVNGYFTDSTTVGASFSALVPSRILDTRYGIGGITGPVGQGQTITVTVAGNGGVPTMASARPPSAVVLNVTVEGATMASDLTVWPAGTSAPVASDLNFSQGQTVPNLVIVKLSPDGKINIRNDFGSTSVIVDVAGWYG